MTRAANQSKHQRLSEFPKEFPTPDFDLLAWFQVGEFPKEFPTQNLAQRSPWERASLHLLGRYRFAPASSVMVDFSSKSIGGLHRPTRL